MSSSDTIEPSPGAFDPGPDHQAIRIAKFLFDHHTGIEDWRRRLRILFNERATQINGTFESLVERVTATRIWREHQDLVMQQPWTVMLPDLKEDPVIVETFARLRMRTLADVCQYSYHGFLRKTGFSKNRMKKIMAALALIGIKPDNTLNARLD